MDRTDICLTEQQETALESRARAAGVSRDVLVRQIIDDALAARPGSRPHPLDPAIGARALVCDVSISDLFDDDIDLR